MEKISIQENFLAEEEFVALRDTITSVKFPWYFSPIVTSDNEKEPTSPGLWIHIVHESNVPFSPFYDSHFPPILEQLNPEFPPRYTGSAVVCLARIKLNLNHRLPEPYFSDFHSDIFLEDHVAAQWTTSILYINTNNGYTEFEDGTKVDSVANRLVSFPANTRHRVVTQTDEQTRIVINFNYLKMI
jgi:hypothetical protein